MLPGVQRQKNRRPPTAAIGWAVAIPAFQQAGWTVNRL
jgi:hypothetical protein